ncbi:MAG: hypothetical protein M0Z96_01905 [Actinomycetota bacterium]|nr:hypothetical protein [Actinomycetota bacterium]
MQLTSEHLERVFGPSEKLDSGLGIVETGSAAGGLSAFLLIGFELLGKAGRQVDSDDLAVKCATLSRMLGRAVEDVAKFIPLISVVDRSSVLSLSGRLDTISTDGLYGELGPLGSISFVRSYLCEFLDAAVSHYLSRCSDLSDRSFARALSAVLSILNELRGAIDIVSLNWNGKVAENSRNLSVFQEILDLPWHK